MTQQIGGRVWTRKVGLYVQMIAPSSQDSGEVPQRGTTAFGLSSKENAAEPVNQVMLINLRLAQMQTGGVHWTGESWLSKVE